MFFFTSLGLYTEVYFLLSVSDTQITVCYDTMTQRENHIIINQIIFIIHSFASVFNAT
jgi:hypothetical protein